MRHVPASHLNTIQKLPYWLLSFSKTATGILMRARQYCWDPSAGRRILRCGKEGQGPGWLWTGGTVQGRLPNVLLPKLATRSAPAAVGARHRPHRKAVAPSVVCQLGSILDRHSTYLTFAVWRGCCRCLCRTRRSPVDPTPHPASQAASLMVPYGSHVRANDGKKGGRLARIHK